MHRSAVPRFLCIRYMVIALVFVSCVDARSADANAPQDAVPMSTDSYTVCHNVAVPPNYGLVGISTNYGCPNDVAYTVAPAQNGMRICNLSETIGGTPFTMPFPSDFVVQSIEHVEYQQSQCGGATAVYVIQPIAEGVTACSGSHIPDGWSYTASLPSNGGCDTTVKNELHQAVEGLRVCTLSPYPDSFVVGAIEPTSACDVQQRYVLRTATDGVKACAPSHVPAGYVITAADRSGQCADYETVTMRVAYDGVIVCTQSPIPNRYVVAATVPYTSCETWATGFQLKYIP